MLAIKDRYIVTIVITMLALPYLVYGQDELPNSIIVKFLDESEVAFPNAKNEGWTINKNSYCIYSEISTLNQVHDLI